MLRKAISVLLSVAICIQSLEASFWAERKAHRADLPAFPLTTAIPPSVSLPNTKASVFILQDVHANNEAQTNLVSILSGLKKRHDTLTVAVEGASGPFDFSAFAGFPRKDIQKSVADNFLEQNWISAPSYFGVVNADRHPVVVGVDDETHYNANVAAYTAAQKEKPRVASHLAEQEKILSQKRATVFNAPLRKFYLRLTDYRANKISFGDYVVSFPDDHNDSVVEQFKTAYQMERSFDFKKVDQERAAILRAVSAKLTDESLRELTAITLAYRNGDVKYADYYRAVLVAIAGTGVSLSNYPAFDKYIRYVLLSDGIEVEPLMAAVKRMEKAELARLCTTEKEKALVDESEFLFLAGRLVEFSLTPEEWEAYKYAKENRVIPARRLAGIPPEFERNRGPGLQHAGATSFSTFEAFYREADLRSHAMVENLLKHPQPIALVAGGFHTPQITALLKQKGVSFAVIKPRITKIAGDSGTAYLSIFNREKSPLERLFEGRTLFLAPQAPLIGRTGGSKDVNNISFQADRNTLALDGQPPGTEFKSNLVSSSKKSGGRVRHTAFDGRSFTTDLVDAKGPSEFGKRHIQKIGKAVVYSYSLLSTLRAGRWFMKKFFKREASPETDKLIRKWFAPGYEVWWFVAMTFFPPILIVFMLRHVSINKLGGEKITAGNVLWFLSGAAIVFGFPLFLSIYFEAQVFPSLLNFVLHQIFNPYSIRKGRPTLALPGKKEWKEFVKNAYADKGDDALFPLIDYIREKISEWPVEKYEEALRIVLDLTKGRLIDETARATFWEHHLLGADGFALRERLRLQETETQEIKHLSAAAYAPSGRLLALGAGDEVWLVPRWKRDGDETYKFKLPPGAYAQHVAFHPKDGLIAVGYEVESYHAINEAIGEAPTESVVDLFDLAGNLVRRIPRPILDLNGLMFSRDGKYIAAKSPMSGGLDIFEVSSGLSVSGVSHSAFDDNLTRAVNGTRVKLRVVPVSERYQHVVVIPGVGGAPFGQTPNLLDVDSVVLSPDEQLMAVIHEPSETPSERIRRKISVSLFDQSGKPVGTSISLTGFALAQFSPDGGKLAVWGNDDKGGYVQLFDRKGNPLTERLTSPIPDRSPSIVLFSPDGDELLVRSGTKVARLKLFKRYPVADTTVVPEVAVRSEFQPMRPSYLRVMFRFPAVELPWFLGMLIFPPLSYFFARSHFKNGALADTRLNRMVIGIGTLVLFIVPLFSALVIVDGSMIDVGTFLLWFGGINLGLHMTINPILVALGLPPLAVTGKLTTPRTLRRVDRITSSVFFRIILILIIESPRFFFYTHSFVDEHFENAIAPATPLERSNLWWEIWFVRASTIAFALLGLSILHAFANVDLVSFASLAAVVAGGIFGNFLAHLPFVNAETETAPKTVELANDPTEAEKMDLQGYIHSKASDFFTLFGMRLAEGKESIEQLGGGTFGLAFKFKVKDLFGRTRFIVAKIAASDVMQFEEPNFEVLSRDAVTFETLYRGQVKHNPEIPGAGFSKYYGKMVLKSNKNAPVLVFMDFVDGKLIQDMLPDFTNGALFALGERLVQIMVHFREAGLRLWDSRADNFMLSKGLIFPIDYGSYFLEYAGNSYIPYIVQQVLFKKREDVPSAFLKRMLEVYTKLARFIPSEADAEFGAVYEQSIKNHAAAEERIRELRSGRKDDAAVFWALKDIVDNKAVISHVFLSDFLQDVFPAAESVGLSNADNNGVYAQLQTDMDSRSSYSLQDLSEFLPVLLLLKRSENKALDLDDEEMISFLVSVRVTSAKTPEDIKGEIDRALAKRHAGTTVVFALPAEVDAETLTTLNRTYNAMNLHFVTNDDRLDLSAGGLREITKLPSFSKVNVAISRRVRLSEATLKTLEALRGEGLVVQLYLVLDEITRKALPVSLADLSELTKFQRLIASQA